MHYQSTRNAAVTASFSAAIEQGLAPDGGLYVPASWPHLGLQAFDGATTQADVGARLLAPFAAGDALAPHMAEICRDAFNFPVPLKPVTTDGRLRVLELFHGPTAAFKDFGARFLAATLSRVRAGQARELHILVATSGDTGGAVAAAFHRRPGFRVSVLYPKGLVSPTQERQLTCWGDNVQSFRVAGTFDDCQRLVKQAFVDDELKQQFDLSSANSINLGRLLPQAVHFALASLQVWRETGQRASFVVPAGNLGHGVACAWARQVGLPIGAIVLAHNANSTVPDFLATGEWQPRPSVPTLASAMDVGNPSNMERLRALFPELAALRGAVRAESVDDAAIANRIKADYRDYAQTWCPHTAAASEVYARLPAAERDQRWVLAATAHPAKFREIVEPLIAVKLAIPATLAALFDRPTQATDLQPSFAALKSALRG